MEVLKRGTPQNPPLLVSRDRPSEPEKGGHIQEKGGGLRNLPPQDAEVRKRAKKRVFWWKKSFPHVSNEGEGPAPPRGKGIRNWEKGGKHLLQRGPPPPLVGKKQTNERREKKAIET